MCVWFWGRRGGDKKASRHVKLPQDWQQMQQAGNNRETCSQRLCRGKQPVICWLNFITSTWHCSTDRYVCAHTVQLWMHRLKGDSITDWNGMVACVCYLCVYINIYCDLLICLGLTVVRGVIRFCFMCVCVHAGTDSAAGRCVRFFLLLFWGSASSTSVCYTSL